MKKVIQSMVMFTIFFVGTLLAVIPTMYFISMTQEKWYVVFGPFYFAFIIFLTASVSCKFINYISKTN